MVKIKAISYLLLLSIFFASESMDAAHGSVTHATAALQLAHMCPLMARGEMATSSFAPPQDVVLPVVGSDAVAHLQAKYKFLAYNNASQCPLVQLYDETDASDALTPQSTTPLQAKSHVDVGSMNFIVALLAGAQGIATLAMLPIVCFMECQK